MKTKNLIYLISLCLYLYVGQTWNLEASEFDRNKSCITYELSGGRLGDNLIAYFHAKWLAYQYDLNFFYQPFPHSNEFNLDDCDQRLDNYSQFEHITIIRNISDIETTHCPSLFICPYFPECKFEFEMYNFSHLPQFDVDWEDPGFKEEVFNCLIPKNPVKTLHIPENYLSVAVHVRRGGNFDQLSVRTQFPLKFPPDSFYIEHIKKIKELYPDKSLYIHIFTDDMNPIFLMQKYKLLINDPSIVFNCSFKCDETIIGVLEDFYSMAKFDCLIRPESNLSLMASKLGDYLIQIYPAHAMMNQESIIIDKVEIIRSDFQGTL